MIGKFFKNTMNFHGKTVPQDDPASKKFWHEGIDVRQ